jgi:hypothetical protein
MRDRGPCSLVFWLSLGLAGCLPAVPRVGSLPAASDAGPAEPVTTEPRGDSAASVPARGGAGGNGAVDAARSSDAPRIDGLGKSEDASAEIPSDAAAASDAPAARPPRPGELVIDELLVDPAGNDLGHEWVEIANLAGEALDLAALHVADAAIEIAVNAGVLPAGGLLVLGQSIDLAHNGDAPVDLAYGTRLSLNNGGDRLALCLGPCANGVPLDAVAWTGPWGEAYAGHAVVIERGGMTCPAGEPYGGDGNFGSPGRRNPPCPATHPETRDGGAGDAARDARGDADAR